MKKLMLAVVLMVAFASTTPAANDRGYVPIPAEDELQIPPPQPPGVPECWPVCN